MEVDETSRRNRNMPRTSPGLDNLSRANKIKEWAAFYLKKLNGANRFERLPHRSASLRAHYNWTSQLMMVFFAYLASSWWGEEPIKCYEQYDLKRAPPEVEDICIQFPYTRNSSQPWNSGEKYYAEFYMWGHWLVLFIGVLFAATRGFIFIFENKPLRSLIQALENTLDYGDRFYMVKTYYQEHFGVHYGMIRNKIFVNGLFLIVDFFLFFGIDILFGRRFWNIPLLLTTKRDPVHFDDAMSIMFPPFAYCDIDPRLHIQVGRHNVWGCELGLMETYGKFFIALYFWLIFLMSWTFFDTVSWIFVYFNKDASKDFLDDGSFKRFKYLKAASKKLSADEALAASKIKPYLYSPHFRAFMETLSTWDPYESDFKIERYSSDPYFPEILTNKLIMDENEKAQDTVETFFISTVSDAAIALTRIGDKDSENDADSKKKDGKDKKDDKKDKKNDDKSGKDKSDKDSKDKDDKDSKNKEESIEMANLDQRRNPAGWDYPLKSFLSFKPATKANPQIPYPSLKNHKMDRYKENSVSDPYLSVAESPEPSSEYGLPPSAPYETPVSKDKKIVDKKPLISNTKKPSSYSDSKSKTSGHYPTIEDDIGLDENNEEPESSSGGFSVWKDDVSDTTSQNKKAKKGKRK